MSSIDRESEDIFAGEEYTDDEEESRCEDVDEEDGDDVSCELTAAVALTSLVSRDSREGNETKDASESRAGKKGDQDMELHIPQRFTKSGRKRAVSFPLKLLKVLSTTKHSDVIAWTASGTAFEIRKPKQFVVDILPKYFKSAKYSSFTRKLHRWNFQRHYRGEEAGAFYHPEFLKDRLDMVEKMTCKLDSPPSASKAKPKTSKSPSSESRKSKAKTKNGNALRPSTQSRPLVTLNATQVVGNYVPSMPPRPTVAQPTSANLSAAIELEVARRLEERISAATFSRQALAMLEQQQQQQQHIQATLNAMIERRFQALLSHQSNLAAVNPTVNNMGSGSSRNLALPLVPPLAPASHPMNMAGTSQFRPMELSQLYQKFKPAPSYNYAFGDDTPALPPTNIQGARTA